MYPQFINVVLFTSLCFFNLIISVTSDGIEEPPFPSMFNQYNKRQIKIVSESVDSKSTYTTYEEYFDYKLGRYTLINHAKGDREVLFQHGEKGKYYIYKPFVCKVEPIKDLSEKMFDDQNWNFPYKMTLDRDLFGTDRAKEIELNLFQVTGIWAFAETSSKFYTNSRSIYSATKDIIVRSYSWAMADQSSGLKFELHFTGSRDTVIVDDVSLPPPDELELTNIEVWSESSGKLLRTINILSIEYEIDVAVSRELFDVPVGYGCFEDYDKSSDTLSRGEYDFNNPVRLVMEISATKYYYDSSSTLPKSQDSAMTNFELGYSFIQHKSITYFRICDENNDVKQVQNYYYNVRHVIDLRMGTCERSHLEAEDVSRANMHFSNGLILSFDIFGKNSVLFDCSSVASIIKKSYDKYNGRIDEIYYESKDQTLSKLFDNKPVRMIWRYLLRNDYDLALVSITIWILNEYETKILESFIFNVHERSPIGTLEAARFFDVSNECYLMDENMKSGKDYAWIELTYPLPPTALRAISKDEPSFKRTFMDTFVRGSEGNYLDFSRVPRLELQFEPEALVLRMLVLGVPSLEIVFDELHDKQIVSLPKYVFLAQDLAHCAELCRLHYCSLFSYEQYSHDCRVSKLELEKVANKLESYLANMKYTSTYILPRYSKPEETFSLKFFHENSLHGIIARLQHQDYGVHNLPKEPNEVKYINFYVQDKDEYDRLARMRDKYWEDVKNYIQSNKNHLPEFTFATTIRVHTFLPMIPAKFEVEQDPLREFRLNKHEDSKDGDDVEVEDEDFESLIGSFHEGLIRTRFNLFSEKCNEASLRQLNDLTYDQCALACLDSKCGSFSYCEARKECITSSANTTGVAMILKIIEQDRECFVYQRDFLTNYIRYPNSDVPKGYSMKSQALDSSDCALECESIEHFSCKGFDFCQNPNQDTSEEKKSGVCFYHGYREAVWSKSDNIQELQCDYYSRSDLADYNKAEYRRIAGAQLQKLKTTQKIGMSVLRCADYCSNRIDDCTAFQFCFNPVAWGPKQECIFIESKPKAEDVADLEATTGGNEASPDEASKIKMGKSLEYDANCRLFALKKNTSKARLRGLAITITDVVDGKGASRDVVGSSAINLFVLYLGLTVATAISAIGLFYLKENNEFVRVKYEQTQHAILGLRASS